MLRFTQLRPGSIFLIVSTQVQEPLHLHENGKLYLYEDFGARSIKWIETPGDIYELLREKDPLVVQISLERLGPLQHLYTHSACRSIRDAVRARIHTTISARA